MPEVKATDVLSFSNEDKVRYACGVGGLQSGVKAVHVKVRPNVVKSGGVRPTRVAIWPFELAPLQARLRSRQPKSYGTWSLRLGVCVCVCWRGGSNVRCQVDLSSGLCPIGVLPG